MLYTFLDSFVKKFPMMTGWNFIRFDWTYILNRCKHLQIDPSIASPTGKLDGRDNFPVHVGVIDYMDLYQNWDRTISVKESSALDYVSNTLIETYPDGQDAEVFTFDALEKAWASATLGSDREHVTPYIKRSFFEKSGYFKIKSIEFYFDYSNIRMTVDEPEDFELIKYLIDKLGKKKTWLEYSSYIIENELKINQHFTRNEGYLKSLLNDKPPTK